MAKEEIEEKSEDAAEAQPEPVMGEVVEEGEAPTSLESQLAQAEAKAAEYLEGWQRAQAEVANIKKRALRDREQAEYEIREKLVRGLLNILDDFDLAQQNLPDEIKDVDWVSGMFAIRRKLLKELEDLGVEEIDPTGEEFDPVRHEAIGHVESADHESGAVANVLRKGYVLGDKVIRAALVQVAS
ncbi:MAG: nucleotide exchange factor GrpE [Chloroflexi bacterium]|nr:nucleotide exchange factor GrpE [Chloroflexota bacterium]